MPNFAQALWRDLHGQFRSQDESLPGKELTPSTVKKDTVDLISISSARKALGTLLTPSTIRVMS